MTLGPHPWLATPIRGSAYGLPGGNTSGEEGEQVGSGWGRQNRPCVSGSRLSGPVV